MTAFPTGVTISVDNVNETTDSPASARADIKSAFDQLNSITASFDGASGIAALDSGGKVANTKLPDTLISSSSANLTLDPDTSMVKIQNFINLNPVSFANLPASPVKGDIAFLTTDGAGATQDQPCYYNGTRWNYFNNTANGGTDAAVATS